MLKILKIELPEFDLEHRNGHRFTVVGNYNSEGVYHFTTHWGWDDTAEDCQQDVESLYEDVEDLIYSAMPELFER